MECYLGLALLLISVISPALSFNTGAPQAACQTLAPDATQHGAQPQVTDVPYVLNLSAFYDPTLDRMVYTPDTVYDSKIFHVKC
jgi:predicted aminopeptidase